MGVVYEAEQESLGRRVALKVLARREEQGTRLLARFRRESRAAARLHHSNIVPVFEVGEDGGVCFYSMQFIQGQALDEVLKELVHLRAASAGTVPLPVGGTGSVASSLWNVPLDAALQQTPPDPWRLADLPRAGAAPGDEALADAAIGPLHRAAERPPSSELSAAGSNFRLYCRNVARIGRQVAEALAYAHARGVIHRDIKPSNLLLDAAGVVWVTDFGLAKTEDHALTQAGDILGTIRYMAPERFRGEDDGRADIYALGLTLYELLVLRPAFAAEDRLRLIDQISRVEPARPRSLEPRIPVDLETIVHKAIDKEPGRRYATAAALAEDLERFLDDRPVQARRATVRERLWRSCRRSPVVSSLAATVATLLVLAALGTTWAAWRFRGLANDLETNLYYERIAVTQHEIMTSPPDLGRAEKLLDECPERLRGWEWRYLKRLWRVEPSVLRDPGLREIYGVAFSPDDRLLASGGGDGLVKVWDLASGKVIQNLDGHGDYIYCVAFSPRDGDLLASGSQDGTVKLWSRRAGAALFSWPGNGGREYGAAYGLAFSPDGKRLAAGGPAGTVKVWSVEGGQEELSLPGQALQVVLSVAFSPDGKRLATGDYGGWVRTWDAASGKLLLSALGNNPPISCLAFSAGGERLVASSFNHHVRLLDAASGEFIRGFRAHTQLALGVALSPDGLRMATCGADGDVKVWDLTRDKEVLVFRAPAAMRHCVVFSRDGERLASADLDGFIRLYDATPLRGDEGQGLLTLRQPVSVWALALSPDGQWIATGGDRFGSSPRPPVAPVSILEASTGKVVRILHGHAVIVFDLAFSPDGHYLASVGDGEDQRRAIVWDLRTGEEAFQGPEAPESRVLFTVAFSRDGRRLVAAGEAKTIQVLDARSGRLIGMLGRHDRECVDLAFSPDGAWLASLGVDGTLKLWDGTRLDQEQEAVRVIDSRTPSATGVSNVVAFDPEGRSLFVGSDSNTATIWDLGTGHLLKRYQGLGFGYASMAVSPDGRWVAAAGTDCTATLIDVKTGEMLHRFRGHQGAVYRVEFLFGPGGKRLVSGSRDGTVKIWDLDRFCEDGGKR
jgi:WD40 repeat protein